jgi:SAM-dependent methyltransferase
MQEYKGSTRERYDRELPNLFHDRKAQAAVMFHDLNRFLKYFNYRPMSPGDTFLDLGSANNDFDECVVGHGLHYIPYNDVNIYFEIDKIAVEDNSIDFVLFKAVIEHLNDATNILQNIYRVLKPNGIALITTPNYEYNTITFWHDPTHKHPYTPPSLLKVMQINQFQCCVVRPFLFRKPSVYWKFPYWFAAKIPFKNHTYQSVPIPKFLRGNSTVLIGVGVKY